MLVQLVTSYLIGIGRFRFEPAHFVERHGLLMLVAFGESVVAIGIGAAGLPLDRGVIAAAVLALARVACLRWAYFTGDSERAEHALRTASPERQTWLAIEGFFYAHINMLLGLVFIAAGVTNAIGHAAEPLAVGPASALAGGVLLHLAGEVAFRRTLGIGSGVVRAVAAGVAPVTIARWGDVPPAAISSGAVFATISRSENVLVRSAPAARSPAQLDPGARLSATCSDYVSENGRYVVAACLCLDPRSRSRCSRSGSRATSPLAKQCP